MPVEAMIVQAVALKSSQALINSLYMNSLTWILHRAFIHISLRC